jgi:colanic acid/amylovoran biosynthesis glycosyltransferase
MNESFQTIGYLIPEFPGQTHVFFWREQQALHELGIKTTLISTRLPPSGLLSHVWSQTAQAETTYLFPFSPKDFLMAFAACLTCGYSGFRRCLTTITNAECISLTQRLRMFAMILVAGKLVRLSRINNFAHIHVHSCADSANIALLAHQLSRLSYSLTLHGPLIDYGFNQKQKWQFARFGVVITQQLYDDIHQSLNGYLPSSIAIAPMGVNLETFVRTYPYVPWQFSQTCFLFSCGRLNPCKGHAYLLQAVVLLKNKGIDVKLDIAGEDEHGGSGYHQNLQALIVELKLSDSVRLLGAVSEQVIREGIENSHAFVLASLNEPLGVAIMEAMAMEVPVVIARSKGVQELIDDQLDGILVEPKNAEAIANGIEKVLGNRDFALALSKAARKKIIEQFSHKRSAEVIALNLRQNLVHK